MPSAAPKLRIHSISRIVIPARMASTRLPRKMLLCETGKALVQHTYEAAQRSARASGVCVATDDREIFEAVSSFGGRAQMTDPAAPSGTDRVAEVARAMTDADIIVNVQGDEPEIAGAILSRPPPSHADDGAPPLLNVLRVCDISDVLGMLAPRPLQIETARGQGWDKVGAIYAAAGQADKLKRTSTVAEKQEK